MFCVRKICGSIMNLVARLVFVAANMQQIQFVIEQSCQSMVQRCSTCITSSGSKFEHLLRHSRISSITEHLIYLTEKLFQSRVSIRFLYRSYYIPITFPILGYCKCKSLWCVLNLCLFIICPNNPVTLFIRINNMYCYYEKFYVIKSMQLFKIRHWYYKDTYIIYTQI